MNGTPHATLSARSAERRQRMTAHVATDWKDADEWDLVFWQQQGPAARLSALVALRRDLAAVCGADRNMEWDD
jgi:hypothetical protein